MEAKWKAVLVSHGSFNPVHRHHIEKMAKARERLERAGYEVVEGIFGITDRGYIQWKGAAAMTDHHRIESLRRACEAAPGPPGWLWPDARGVNYGSASQMIRNCLQDEIERRHPGAVIFNVMGSDVIGRYSVPRSMAGRGPIVVVGRAGTNPEVEAVLKQWDGQDYVFYVEELPGEYSSTRVREALLAGDREAVLQLVPEATADYLLSRTPAELYGEEQEPWRHEQRERSRPDSSGSRSGRRRCTGGAVAAGV